MRSSCRIWGCARLIHASMAPQLAIHGSTQMTLTEPRGIEFVRKLGVSRVVLARELSIQDVRRIKSATEMELEVFVHGAALRLLFGTMPHQRIAWRSRSLPNRGQCGAGVPSFHTI